MAHPVSQDGRPRDQALVAALRRGDEETFASLVDGWAGSMLRLARRHVATDDAAEEVVQETWLAVLTGLDGFRGHASFRTWVYRILVNQAKTRGIRDHRTVPFASLTADDTAPSVDPSRFRGPEDRYPGGWREFPAEWPEEVILSQEVHEVVSQALDTLPERQRVVVALRDVEGFDADEVCQLLDISAGNQRVLLHRGRSVVRSHLEEYFAGAVAGGDRS